MNISSSEERRRPGSTPDGGPRADSSAGASVIWSFVYPITITASPLPACSRARYGRGLVNRNHVPAFVRSDTRQRRRGLRAFVWTLISACISYLS